MLIFPLILSSFLPSVLAVVGGDPVIPYNYPFHVAIRYAGKFRCGGFIYSDRYVVSSAACFLHDPSEFLVVAAEHNVYCQEGYEEVRLVKRVIYPEGRTSGTRIGVKDIALAELVQPFKFTTHVKKADIVEDPAFTFPQTATIIGWGNINRARGPFAHFPLQAALPITDVATCNVSLAYNLREGNICYGGLQRSACQLDLGSPLLCDGKVCAIFNLANQCGADGKPGIFTSIPFHAAWLKKESTAVVARSASKDPEDMEITTCGGYYETMSGTVQLKGLNAGQKCFFAIKSPLEEFSLTLNETTLTDDDGIFVTVFCLANPCERWKMENLPGTKRTVRTSLVIITVQINNTNPTVPRGVTLTFNASGSEDLAVPNLSGFTVLNSTTPTKYSYPPSGGQYGNHELAVVIFDLPEENRGFKVSMTQLDLEGPGEQKECLYDAISLFGLDDDWFPMISRVCGNKPPGPLTFPGNFGILSMISDNETVGKGFTLEYK